MKFMLENIKKVPQKAFNSQEFIEKTVLQINKDFPQEVQPILNVTDAEQVYFALRDRISFLVKECKRTIPQYIYQVDLPEKKVNQVFSTTLEQAIDNLTMMVLEREAQKVYIRSVFS